MDAQKAKEKLPAGVRIEMLKTGNVGLTALLLLSEKFQGEKSRYFEYIKSLPEVAPGVLSWGKDDLEELYRSTTRRIRSQINAVEQDFVTISERNVFPMSVFTKEAFFWAVGTVCTTFISSPKHYASHSFNPSYTLHLFQGVVKARSMVVKGLSPQRVLVPGIDYLQFDPFSTSEPFTVGAGYSLSTLSIYQLSNICA